MDAPRVLVYTKPGCHLCDEMLDLLRLTLRARDVPTVERNITQSVDDYERYKHDIPVLVIDGREVARHRITEEHRCLAQARHGNRLAHRINEAGTAIGSFPDASRLRDDPSATRGRRVCREVGPSAFHASTCGFHNPGFKGRAAPADRWPLDNFAP